MKIEEINIIRQKARKCFDECNSGAKKRILVCGGKGCSDMKSHDVRDEFIKQIKEMGLENEVQLILTGCFGLCGKGPIVAIAPEEDFYTQVKPEHIKEILTRHILKNEKALDGMEKKAQHQTKENPFLRHQNRMVLKNCGHIDPENIDEYLGLDGYKAYEKSVKMTPLEVIETITESGLRGRGGGGFSCGKKWMATYQAKGDQKYVVCNADEGDPGAFMDRSILEGNPHSVLEAMMIAGYAVGASIGYIYIRAEYPLAVNRLQIAIDQARAYGILGDNCLGTGQKFDISLRLGAGAFVCGEATALIASIEGNRGEPRQKPPHLAEEGLWGMPTVLNNVETFANIPLIMLNGAQWFHQLGNENNRGTKVFALGGKIENTGLVEIPMGTTLRTIVNDIGGGCIGGKKFKAAQTGGPSGGCIPASLMDTPIDYDNLIKIGSMMGSGGLIVMDEDNCMVDIAKFFLEFTVDESCGKCTPCRIGNKRLYELLDKVSKGQATMEDLDKIEKLCEYIKNDSLCALGQSAPNPVISTIKYFKDEYIAHIKDKKCPAGVCKDLLDYFITDACIGCGICKKKCPTNAISGDIKALHVIDREKCIKCGACMAACPKKAIVKK